MEDNPALRDNISDFVYESYNTVDNDRPISKSQPEIVDKQGNVVYLSFNTKTKGSA